jgi:hypothetical protein
MVAALHPGVSLQHLPQSVTCRQDGGNRGQDEQTNEQIFKTFHGYAPFE